MARILACSPSLASLIPLEQALRSRGHRVVGERSMVRAPRRCLEGGFDLVLVDGVDAPGRADARALFRRLWASPRTRGVRIVLHLDREEGLDAVLARIEEAVAGTGRPGGGDAHRLRA